ncbi:efflux RND transporter permease subunit [Chroococcidiopsis sp. CCNUC1]|uniref:efflux RND transporter permease subunit n=1 Tax=Chroococcidiopsis sp. CCNUC1 TaxID=2653189 RepID=UPI0020208DE4|nr:efflux RND transporter permease subunit [Chroococcidiopsis sp. CCNUC1]URD49890.1 efflux RND transporter permease subunit [Chroococcidiopsis sp. CCNUC1]
MSTLFYRNRQLLLLALTLILVWGLSSFFTLPRLEDPEITQRVSTITTLFPGASTERVEALVSKPIEDELSEIEEIDSLESRSQLGISVVTVNLKESVRNVDRVWEQVRSEVDDVIPRLPQGARSPVYEDREVKANALIIGLTWETNTPPNYAILRRTAERLEDKLRYLPGTQKVEIFGAPEEEMRVEISPAELSMLGITAAELSQQILASDAKISAGQLRGQNNELSFEVAGELDSLERIRNIPIRTENNGQVTRLGDIAQVNKGIIEPAASLSFVVGKPAIALAATVESAMRVDAWAQAAKQALQEFQTQLPKGISLHTILDQSRYVQQRINGVLWEMAFGSLLAMAVILFMMGWRSAVVVGAALPLATLLAFGCMEVLNVPLHQISMTGLVIAIGLLIDNAIVMADEVQVRLQRGMKARAAIADSIHHILVPLLSSTLTTVLAFLPIALAPGGVGEFTGTIGVTGILGLTSSLVISLTILPALSGRLHQWSPAVFKGILPPFLRGFGGILPFPRGVRGILQSGFSHPQLTRIYRRSLQLAFSRPAIAVGLALILPTVGFTLAPHLPQQFFPPSGRDQFYIEVEFPSQAGIEQTRSQVLQARELILQQPEVTDVHWFLGESAPTFYYNIVGSQEDAANYAQGLVQLRPNTLSRPIIQSLQTQLDRAFPGAQILVRQIEQGPPFDAPVEVRLYGADLTQLRKLGDRLRAEMAQIKEITHTRASLTEAQPKLAVNVDEEQARMVGLDRSAIARQLDANLEGTTGGSVLEATEELPVRVRLSNSGRSNLEQISDLDLLPTDNRNSQTIPLSTVGNISLVPDLAVIRRRNGQRVNVVQGFMTAGTLPANALTQLQQRLQQDNFQLPPGYSFEFGGESEERNTAVGNILSTVGVLGVLMTATLVLTFNSFALAASIGAIAILSVGLGLGALWLSGYPFGFTAILGTIGLIGIAVNEATVVIAALQADVKASTGDRHAVEEVVVRATRHLIATTITDMAGFTPLLFDPTGFWNPLAIVIAGGLGGVTLLSMYFVPAVYLLWTKTRHQSVTVAWQSS